MNRILSVVCGRWTDESRKERRKNETTEARKAEKKDEMKEKEEEERHEEWKEKEDGCECSS
jgi:hypothetical protein